MQLKTDWDLSKLDISNKKLENTKNAIAKFVTDWNTRTDYLQDPQVLLQALLQFDFLLTNYGTSGDTGYYWGLRHTLDQNDAEVTANMNKIDELSTKLQNDLQFFTIRLSKISSDVQNVFLNDPKLSDFKHFLQKLFAESKYILSEPEEKILNLKSNSSHHNWVKMTATLLSKETRDKKTLDQLISDFKSDSSKIRDQAALSVNDILSKYVEVAEHEINSILADKKVNDELRGVTRPDFMRHLSDDIDTGIVDTLVASVSARFDQAHRFYRLKAKALGVPYLKYHERIAPVGKITKKYSYPQAVDLVSQTFSSLDSQFAQIFDEFVNNGHIDVLPKKGKRGGAFCTVERPTTPTYILLNHSGKLQDVLTLAHEVGHGINNELMRTQKFALNFGSPLSTAEVASTFMEDFVLQRLLSKSSPAEQFALIMQKLDDDISTIYRQIACYKFETDLHQSFRTKGYLSKEKIGEIFTKNMAAYMGKFVKQSPGSQNYWVYWSHIRSFFYVYSYASGLLISKSLQAQVKKDPKFIIKVKEFLSAGSSASPKQIFLNLGIDISDPNFWTSGLDEIESLLATAERLYKEVN